MFGKNFKLGSELEIMEEFDDITEIGIKFKDRKFLSTRIGRYSTNIVLYN